MKNHPKSIFLGWTALAVCALGGYLGSKAYTNNRLRDYTAKGGFGTTSSAPPDTVEQDNTTDASGNKPLRRSVQRSL